MNRSTLLIHGLSFLTPFIIFGKTSACFLFAAYAFATPLLFVSMLLVKIPPQAALITAVLVVRTTAGLRADTDIRNHIKVRRKI